MPLAQVISRELVIAVSGLNPHEENLQVTQLY